MRIVAGVRTAVMVAVTSLAATAEAQVVGRVVSIDGSPVAGATIEAFGFESNEEAGERRVAGQARTPVATATAGADGVFRLESKQPLAWVQANAPGHAPAVVSLADGPAAITLRVAPLRRGTITANGAPVEGAAVFWIGQDGAERMVRTDAKGAFEAPDPAGVPIALLVIHPGFAPLQSDAGGPGTKPGLDRELEPGVRIAGSAVDEASGRPVKDAQVWLDDAWPLARTDAKGAFAIAHAPRDWARAKARSPRLVGAVERMAGPLVVRMKPARSLTGTVTDRLTRQPLSGAMVWAGTSSEESASTMTDARGQYTLEGLPPGRYRMHIARVGYQAEGRPWNDSHAIDLRTSTSARFDAALRPLPRVRGRVEDEQHRALEGALVVLVGARESANIYAMMPTGRWSPFHGSGTRTAADGSFELALVSGDEPDTPAGSATVERRISVLKSGFAAAQVTAAAGDNPSPLVVTLSHGIELQGRVTATDGTPVAGVAVSAAEDGSVGGMYASHLLLTEVRKEGWATSDESGRFALRVNPGPHHLSFDRAGYAHQVVRSHDPRSGPLDVVLEPAAAVRGRVTRADGRALASAIVGIGSSPRTAQGVEDVLTNGEGRFELGGLTPGVHELRVRHEGLGAMLVRTVEAPADDVQVVLAPSVTVRGRVLDAASRQPVPRFELVLTTAGSHREVPVEDPAGSFTVEEVPIGEARLSISAEGYAERKVEGLSFERDDEPAPLEILLDAEALVRGRVTDQAGAPLPEANVGVLGPGPYRSQTTSGEDGEYELHGVPPGETRLGFSAAGYVSETRAIDTRESTRLDVTLKRGLTLRGEVVKAGAGVPEAHVAARTSVAGASLQTTQTDDKGRFVLEGLVPGRYTVTARASGAGSARLDDVDAQTAGPLRLTLDKAPTAVIRGKVVGLSERDLGITMIVVSSEETRESAHGSVDSSMAFRIEDAPAGRVKVLGVATSMEEGVARSSRTVELTVPPGTEAETVIEFASDIVVSGTVTRDGGPVPFAKVTFRSDLDGGAAARADTRGHYEAVGLEPGFYQVSVTGDDVSFVTEYAVTASAEFDIDVTGGSIEGHVVHADGGAPVAGVDVSFFRLGRGENRPAGSATTGARGAFAERPLREGRYRLVTSMAGFGQEVREVDLPRGGTVEAVIELSPADGVGVTVVDARDSRPLDAIVVVRDQARRIVANRHSGADESGALHIPLADGAYLLSTSASGYGTVTLPVTAPAQGLRVGLTPGGTLVIESERDLRGRVRLVQPDGEEYVRCWCNGIAEIQLKGRRTNVENVTPGSYTVEIVDSPEATPPRPVVVREGQTSTVVIE